MISMRCAAKLIAVGAASVMVATGCATAKKGEMAEPAAAAAPAAAMASEPMMPDSYTVVSGDHLWGISAQDAIYGDPYEWPIIYSHNRAQIKDADLIFPGQVFTIPRQFKPREVANAIKHAKTRGPWSLGPTEASDTAYLAATPM